MFSTSGKCFRGARGCHFTGQMGKGVFEQLIDFDLPLVAIDPDIFNVLLATFHCLPIRLHTNVFTNGANRPAIPVQFIGANVAVD